MNRRSFLKGSSLAATAFAGALALAHRAQAQDQTQGGTTAGKPDDQTDAREPPGGGEKKDPNRPTDEALLVTRKDETGRDYRVCPQCGYNMYLQDRTWTCENCGFSYSE